MRPGTKPLDRRPSTLAVVVGCHGLGHWRRTATVLARLTEMDPNVQLDVFIDPETLRLGSNWLTARSLRDRARYHFGYVEAGVFGMIGPADWEPHSGAQALSRMHSAAALMSADVVISDNLAGVLTVRPDAVLMGNFLWSEVMETNRLTLAARRQAESEFELVAKRRPPMLCTADIAMPRVLNYTAAIKLGWMCEFALSRRDMPRTARPKVGVLGGRARDGRQLRTLIAELPNQRRYQIEDATSATGGEAYALPLTQLAAYDAVVCRPGIGTVTDCVATETVMVALDVHRESEIQHNAGRLVELGVAVDTGPEPTPFSVAAALERVLEPSFRSKSRSCFRALDRSGAIQAADWLYQRLASSAR